MVLEHYKFPHYFIRRTKKAYISLATDKMLSIAKEADINHGYNTIKLAVRRRGLGMHMNFCRKNFATYLRVNGIEQEFVDLLQGRMPRSVFVRHYFRPDFDKATDRVEKCIGELEQQIVCKQ